MKYIAAILAVAASPLVQGQNLIVNGDFELVTGGTSGHVGVSGFSLNGWTVTRLSGSGASQPYSWALVGTPAALSQAGSGVSSAFGTFNLWGTVPSSPSGGNILAVEADQSWVKTEISQVVSGLTPGETYTLKFDWAAGQQSGFYGPTVNQWDVSFGGQPASSTTELVPSQGFVGWWTHMINFTASNASETLSFIANGGPGGLPPFALLDNVQLSLAAVPEPGEYAAAFAGLLVVAGVVRKIRANQAQ